jgi:hypothetical protein
MRHSRVPTVIASIAGTVAIVLAVTAAVDAQRRGRADNSIFGAPVATNTVVENPDEYVGKVVTITAGVEQMVSKTTFLMDQRRAAGATDVKTLGKPLLVIAPYLTSSLELKKYFLVRGQIVKLEATSLARLAPDYVLDIPDEVSATFMGQPVLVAASVLNSTYAELARKPIPPATPADVALTSAMKTISPAFNALRTAAQESKTDLVKEQIALLTPAFAQTESIFGDVKHANGASRAREATTQVAAIETALAAGNWEAVKSSANALNTTCQSCHTAYRERQDDGTFRMKSDAVR